MVGIMSTNKNCFVISPIGKEGSEIRQRSDLLLNHIIKPVIEKNGYDVNRADDLSQPGIITHQIIDELINADLVIADLSSFNPNVFYELAVRHAAEKPIIHMIEWGQDLPFDIANFRTIFYGIRIDQAEKAKLDLESHVNSISDGKFVPNNPIVTAKRFSDIQKNLKSETKSDSQDVMLLLLDQVSNLQSNYEKLSNDLRKKPPLDNTITHYITNEEYQKRILDLTKTRIRLQDKINIIDTMIKSDKTKKEEMSLNQERNFILQKIDDIDRQLKDM